MFNKEGTDLSPDLWTLSTQKKEVRILSPRATQGPSESHNPVKRTAAALSKQNIVI